MAQRPQTPQDEWPSYMPCGDEWVINSNYSIVTNFRGNTSNVSIYFWLMFGWFLGWSCYF